MTFSTSQTWVTTGPPVEPCSPPPFDTGAAEAPTEPRLLECADEFVAAQREGATEPASMTFSTSRTWVTTEPSAETFSAPPFDKGAAEAPMEPRMLEGVDDLVAADGEAVASQLVNKIQEPFQTIHVPNLQSYQNYQQLLQHPFHSQRH